MKKAIIVLTILTLLSIGFVSYKGYQYIISLNSLVDLSYTKSEIIDPNIELELKNIKLEDEYNQKIKDLLNDNLECELWKNQEEALKKITE